MNVPKAADLSVIIPVYNGERYLGAAIESVLSQSLPPREVIVIDDGSSDASTAVARGFPQVRLIEQENAGAAAARNHGVSVANCANLAFLDADDLWTPEKTVLQMAKLTEDPTLDAIFGHAVEFRGGDPSALVGRRSGRGTKALSKGVPAYLPSALIIRRKAFDAVGGYATNLDVAEVVEWHARAEDKGLRMDILPQVVMKRRLHDSNLGVRKRDSQTDYARVLKLVLDRRRNGVSS